MDGSPVRTSLDYKTVHGALHYIACKWRRHRYCYVTLSSRHQAVYTWYRRKLEGNRRSGVALAMCHRHRGLSTYGLNGQSQGDEHPHLCPFGAWHHLLYLTQVVLEHSCYTSVHWTDNHSRGGRHRPHMLCSTGDQVEILLRSYGTVSRVSKIWKSTHRFLLV